jgi:hypothetical protein
MAGFAQQSDMHDGSATIREALEFSALLRQSSLYSKIEKLAYVDHVLDIMDLTHTQMAWGRVFTVTGAESGTETPRSEKANGMHLNCWLCQSHPLNAGR